MAYAPKFPRVALSALLLAGLSSCYADLAPPGDIGSVGSITPVEPAPTQTAYRVQEAPVNQTAGSVDYLNTPNLAGVGSSPARQDNQASIYEGQGTEPGLFDQPFGEPMIAESNSSQPIVAGIGTGELTVQNGQQNAGGSDNLWQGQPVVIGTTQTPPPQPQQVAMRMPVSPQAQPAPQSMPGNVMPASERNCRAQLRQLGAKFRDLPRIHDSAACTIDYPLKLEVVSGDVDVKPDATLNCQMALTFAKWVKSELEPAARLRFLSGVKSIRQMSSYSCRRMNSSSRNPWSEHSRGNAIDIGTITLNNGKQIDVRKKSFFSFREKGLLKSVRSDSCKYFNTVLGPGSDRHHKDHFHFDLRHRKSGKRYCSL